MKNPLRKRVLRELRDEIGKYLVVFILMVSTIGFVSGFLVADGSMMTAYNESFEKYNIEDGNFRTDDEIHRSQREKIEAEGVTLYENFYIENEIRAIQKISKEDVDRAARQLLVENNMGFAAIGADDAEKLVDAVEI